MAFNIVLRWHQFICIAGFIFLWTHEIPYFSILFKFHTKIWIWYIHIVRNIPGCFVEYLWLFQQNPAKLIKLHEKYTGIQKFSTKHPKIHTFPYHNSEFHTFHDLEKQRVEFHTFPGIPYWVWTLYWYGNGFTWS